MRCSATALRPASPLGQLSGLGQLSSVSRPLVGRRLWPGASWVPRFALLWKPGHMFTGACPSSLFGWQRRVQKISRVRLWPPFLCRPTPARQFSAALSLMCSRFTLRTVLVAHTGRLTSFSHLRTHACPSIRRLQRPKHCSITQPKRTMSLPSKWAVSLTPLSEWNLLCPAKILSFGGFIFP